MFGDGKPNCIILDEIDCSVGAEGQGAVDLVVKLCKDTVNAQGRTGGGYHADAKVDEEMEEDAEGGEGVQRRRGVARKQKVSVLRRPIICICNDLYVHALRPLRAVAQLVKFTPPQQQRMIARLQHICHEEKLSADRQAFKVVPVARNAQRRHPLVHQRAADTLLRRRRAR